LSHFEGSELKKASKKYIESTDSLRSVFGMVSHRMGWWGTPFFLEHFVKIENRTSEILNRRLF